MSPDVRLRYLDGTSETHVRMDLGERHHYVIITRDGMSCDLIEASVVKETEEAKVVDLRVRS